MIDYQNLESKLAYFKKEYRSAKPFPWVIFESFLEPKLCEEMAGSFGEVLSYKDPLAPKKHKNVLRKTGTLDLGRMTTLQQQFFKEVASEKFLNFLKEVTGIDQIYSDPELFGGGLHEIHDGGYLNVHTDFNFHPKTEKNRRLNLILYLNENWNSEFNGNLEFWDHKVKKCHASVAPIINRCVLFETSEISFHGHPTPLSLPKGVTRKSMAVYYYSEWPAGISKRPATNYKLTPQQKKTLRELIVSCQKKGLKNKKEIAAAITTFEAADVARIYEELSIPWWKNPVQKTLQIFGN